MPVTDACTVLLTPDEYFAWEERQDVRHEYAYGEVFPVPDSTLDHALIASNLVSVLGNMLVGRSAFVLTGGMRVQIDPDRYAYPDLSVTLGEPAFRADSRKTTLLNPTLLVEVASPSTAGRDRGRKLTAYTRLESLAEYWMVEPDRAEATRVVRTDDGWGLRFAFGLDAVLASHALGVSVALADVYRLVTFEAPGV